MEDIENNIHNLDIKNGKYEFLLEGIEGTILSANVKQTLPYNRKKIISEIVDELEYITETLENHRAKIDMERNQFIQFLDSNVKDI